MKRGQTLIEYVLVLALLLVVAALSRYLLTAIDEKSSQTEVMLSSDYP